jgi:hypothetical protein
MSIFPESKNEIYYPNECTEERDIELDVYLNNSYIGSMSKPMLLKSDYELIMEHDGLSSGDIEFHLDNS